MYYLTISFLNILIVMSLQKITAIVLLLCVPICVSAEEINWILVEESGNPANRHSVGRVDYEFEIMATEVPNWLYCKFLNAVARKDDPYGLWSPLMESHFMGGVIRSFDGTHYKYTLKAGMENKPVTSVHWVSCLRFANWFHYGCPTGSNASFNAVAGDTTHGAYRTDLLASEGFKNGTAMLHRNKEARYWLPNRNEWVKAGYYIGNGKWNDYPFRVNGAVASAVDSNVRNGANFYENGWANPAPHLSDVGAYCKSQSYFGTYDQGGNVAEWIEDRIPGSSWFAALGGSAIRGKYSMRMGYREGDALDKSISTFGFRLARRKTDDANWNEQVLLPEWDPRPIVAPVKTGRKNGVTADEDFVLVGGLHNKPDLLHGGFGRVDYPYEISKYELSNQQYAEFLNAVASCEDPFGLYNKDMATGITGGIRRIGSAGAYKYIVKITMAKKPVAYIGYYDLMRYANWRHFGMPRGNCVIGVTEGTSVTGAYNTQDIEKILNGLKKASGSFGVRNTGAKYWIPSQDEWYKAAYHDPTRLGARKYWDFPCRTDNVPDNREEHIRSCNYLKGAELGVGPPAFLADVDSYQNSKSYWGTLQQGGNVWEWVEGWQYGIVGIRGLRGGSWGYTEYGLFAGNIDSGGIKDEIYVFGGRIAKAYTGDEIASPPLPSIKELLRERLENVGFSELLSLILISFCAGIVVIMLPSLLVVIFLKKRKK